MFVHMNTFILIVAFRTDAHVIIFQMCTDVSGVYGKHNTVKLDTKVQLLNTGYTITCSKYLFLVTVK